MKAYVVATVAEGLSEGGTALVVLSTEHNHPSHLTKSWRFTCSRSTGDTSCHRIPLGHLFYSCGLDLHTASRESPNTSTLPAIGTLSTVHTMIVKPVVPSITVIMEIWTPLSPTPPLSFSLSLSPHVGTRNESSSHFPHTGKHSNLHSICWLIRGVDSDLPTLSTTSLAWKKSLQCQQFSDWLESLLHSYN